MKLYVMRHGPAEDFASSGRDADRALTASGRDRVRDVAKLLVKSDEAPRVIISSPLVRALQTAEIVAAEVGVDKVETSRELAPGGDAYAFARSLVHADRRRSMIIGHEPDLSSLVAMFLGGSFAYDMLKAMVVGLHLPHHVQGGDEPRLRFVLDPKTLKLEHDDKSV